MEPRETECPRCKSVINGRPSHCPVCALRLTSEEILTRPAVIPDELNVEMILVTAEMAKASAERARKEAKLARDAVRPERRRDFWRYCLHHWERGNKPMAASMAFSERWADKFLKWPEHPDFAGFPVRPEYNRSLGGWKWRARFQCPSCETVNVAWEEEYWRHYDEKNHVHYIDCAFCDGGFSPRFDFKLELSAVDDAPESEVGSEEAVYHE
jgi:hypothetical protein